MLRIRSVAGAALALAIAAPASAQPAAPASATDAVPPPPGAAPAAAPPVMNPGAVGYRPITPMATMNIIAELRSAGEFTTLLKALDTAGLTSLLSTRAGLTLFAPTDAAFAALPAGEMDTLTKNPQQLQAMLAYHLINARVTPDQVQGHAAGPVMTVANKNVTIDGSGSTIKVNDANVLQAAVPASNGLIYVIDKVLTPTP